MSAAQEISNLYTEAYCVYAACAILVYDWFLCLSQEVRFIWNWHSTVTSSSLVYALSRYAVLIEFLLVLATNYPMSDLIVTSVLGTIAVSAFSALRAYALSNRNIWLTAIIILLALPPTAMNILVDLAVSDARHQLAAELLVVGITWWYSYQSYRMRRGINLGKTISSFLVYNGSLYFLFLATLYILDIIFGTTSISEGTSDAADLLELFFDPLTSIFTCRFMLELRQFDSSPASVTCSEAGSSRVQEHTVWRDVLQFAAQPSDSLPAFIASFGSPVHVDSAVSETDPDAIDDSGAEWQEMDVVAAPTRMTPSSQSSARAGVTP
ncbi:hypothetical protein LXA43DRAFT_1066798 [Ganoderma leucocontextum]|nr:hypothetical protein LXA43DRAFT_1066798 [Ganoderma leucocontextum]